MSGPLHTELLVGFCIAYLAIILVVGLWSGRGASNSVAGFVAGDRRVHGVLLYFIIGAAVYSSFAFLGTPGWAYSRGAAALYVLCFSAIGVIPLYFFGPIARQWGQQKGFVTQAEMMGWRFRSRLLQGVLALIGVAVLIPYLTLQMKGAGLILYTLSGGDVPVWAGAGMVYGVVLTYVWRSGVMGVGWTNAVQGLLMMATAWFLGLYIPWHLHSGIDGMFAAIHSAGMGDMLAAPGLAPGGGQWTWWEFSSWVLVSAIGFSCWPHIFMKCFAAPSDRQIRLTVVLYPTFQIMMIPLLFLGFAAVMVYPAELPVDGVVPYLLVQTGIPVIVAGFAAVGILAASMSTGDTLLHAAASISIRDGLGACGLRPKRDEQERRIMRATVVAIAIFAYWFAVGTEITLVALLAATYGGVAQLMPGLLAAFYWRGASAFGVLVGLLAGISVNALFLLQPDWRPLPMHEGIYGLAANASLLTATSLLSGKTGNRARTQGL